MSIKQKLFVSLFLSIAFLIAILYWIAIETNWKVAMGIFLFFWGDKFFNRLTDRITKGRSK